MTELTQWFEDRKHWCISLLRIYLGIGLVLKGLSFIMQRDMLQDMLANYESPMLLGITAHFIILAHIGGGLMMAVGFATRLGALIQVPILTGAVFLVHFGGGVFQFGDQLRFSALVLVLLVLYVWHGSGVLSLDSYLERQEQLRIAAKRARESAAADEAEVAPGMAVDN